MSNAIAKKNIKPVKRKMQNVNFADVEEFLAFLPEDELKIVERLRKIVFSCIPDCVEKLNYNVPFYKMHSNICFIEITGLICQKITIGKTKPHTSLFHIFSPGNR